ncbi:hypothetical protein MKEN_00534500 [Mycena kentingensis (nom. inval.)]|nr:hypothetical protein MKEN_00534500 [Mycena kentingensis (nom. inval.)]
MLPLLSAIFLFISLLVTRGTAQRADIGAPKPDTLVCPGSSLLVEVDRPNSLTNSDEIAIVIGGYSCSSFTQGCSHFPPTALVGQIFYSGPFTPAYSRDAWFLPPHQNFTVTIPETMRKGPMQLNLVHFSLVGATASPLFEGQNITLRVGEKSECV